MYISYICKTCRKEFVLLASDVDKHRFLVCPYCCSRRVKPEEVADVLKDCMKERSYKRNKRGAIEQRRFD